MPEKQSENLANDRGLQIRSLRIKFLRTLFLVAIIVSAALFVGMMIFGFLKPKNEANKNVVKGDKLVIEKPTFIGHSIENGRVIVTADEAKRQLGNGVSDIELINPVMQTQFGSQIKAKTGIWNETRQELTLKTNVEMTHSNGDKAYAQNAYYGRIASPDGKGFMLAEPIIYLTQNVQFARKSGEHLESNSGIWNDKTQELKLGDDVKINVPQIISDNNSYVNIIFAKGNASSKAATFLLKDNVIFGSGNTSLKFDKIAATSDRYEFHSDTKRIILNGHAHATFSQ